MSNKQCLCRKELTGEDGKLTIVDSNASSITLKKIEGELFVNCVVRDGIGHESYATIVAEYFGIKYCPLCGNKIV